MLSSCDHDITAAVHARNSRGCSTMCSAQVGCIRYSGSYSAVPLLLLLPLSIWNEKGGRAMMSADIRVHRNSYTAKLISPTKHSTYINDINDINDISDINDINDINDVSRENMSTQLLSYDGFDFV